ncbi:MAG: hypothetical protein HQM10_07475 [Candidatus Riflebacteria bacterium]|nr:hypothetical protein [Candidatus Riflebacteria bacterium]
MRPILSLMVVLMVFAFACTAFAQDEIDNPMYQKWATFKVGTAAKYKQVTEAAGNKTESEIVYTLVELTPEKAVVEMSGSMVIMGNKTEMPKTKMEHMAKVKKIEMPAQVATETVEAAKPKVSEEEVEVPAGKIKCSLTETEAKVGEGAVYSKIWSSDEVPGTMVKMTSTMEKPIKSDTSITLIEVIKP